VFGWNSSDPQTQWLTITNIVLGIIVAISLIVMMGGIAHEIVSRVRRRRRYEAEIERDMRELADTHAFHVPGVGVTMADGGEKLPPASESDKH
jgi:hypothetical protein